MNEDSSDREWRSVVFLTRNASHILLMKRIFQIEEWKFPSKIGSCRTWDTIYGKKSEFYLLSGKKEWKWNSFWNFKNFLIHFSCAIYWLADIMMCLKKASSLRKGEKESLPGIKTHKDEWLKFILDCSFCLAYSSKKNLMTKAYEMRLKRVVWTDFRSALILECVYCYDVQWAYTMQKRDPKGTRK